jgi:cytochrome c-type biogenesis protein CcmH
MKWLISILVLICLTLPALAVNPDEILDDPALESRARALSSELRCLVCQNQSIDDSDAELARDLRVIVRERLTAGDTDDEVLDYVVARYGEFVLLRPVLGPHTVVLWIAAPAVFLLGLGGAWLALRKRDGDSPDLTAEEQRALDALAADSLSEKATRTP